MSSQKKKSRGKSEVQRVRQRVFAVCERYDSESAVGGCSTSTHRDLQSAVFSYWRALQVHSDEKAVENYWQENNLDEIPKLRQTMVKRRAETPGYGSSNRYEKRPKIATLSAEELLDYIRKLDGAAKKLDLVEDTGVPVDRDPNPI